MIDSSPRRVVITGMGPISPIGTTKDAFWDSLASGRSGVKRLESVPVDHLPVSFGAEATDFTGHIDDFGPLEKMQKRAIRKALKVMSREIQYGVAAAQLALADAGIEFGDVDPNRTGVVYGCDYIMTLPGEFTDAVRSCIEADGQFHFDRWAEDGLTKITPLWLLKYLPNMPASHIAIFNDFRGPNNSITLREASANLAMAEAYLTIQRGLADVIVTGATGTRVHPMRTVHVAMQEELAPDRTDPTAMCRPFDKNRTGMVLGEGGAAIVLEELEAARTRGADVVAEVVGYGSSTVMDRAAVAHLDVALENVIRQALRTSGMSPDEVGHVSAHGLSTHRSDAAEASAIRTVFGDRTATLPVTAAKSYFGNPGAGSGTLELIASVLAMRNGRLFRTLNYETPDPQCPINVVATDDVDPGGSVLSLNVSPQGQAGALLVRAFCE